MQANSLEDICDNFLDIMINANQVTKSQFFSHIKFLNIDYYKQPVVYFEQRLGAAQFKYWSKSPFLCFYKILMQNDENKAKRGLLGPILKCW